MKGSFLWKLMYVFCALAGVLAGYGVFSLANADDIKPNINTKDSTLVRESGDSVFFDGEKEVGQEMSLESTSISQDTESPKVLPTSEPTVTLTPTPAAQVSPVPSPHITAEPQLPEPTILPEPEVGHAVVTPQPGNMPSLAEGWAENGVVMRPAPSPVNTSSVPEGTQPDMAAETLTYPAEIFGQVPVINRSDAYVSYFEFAYDLIAMLEPQVKERGLNMNSLLTRFAIKALFCGVEIEKLDINAPIPRRLAALCLWLTAQVLNEDSSDTNAKSAQKYVTDIGGCSNAEKKAVAYLYELGILKGYQTPGQKFYPDAGLKTESGSIWLSGIKQCWK